MSTTVITEYGPANCPCCSVGTSTGTRTVCPVCDDAGFPLPHTFHGVFNKSWPDISLTLDGLLEFENYVPTAWSYWADCGIFNVPTVVYGVCGNVSGSTQNCTNIHNVVDCRYRCGCGPCTAIQITCIPGGFVCQLVITLFRDDSYPSGGIGCDSPPYPPLSSPPGSGSGRCDIASTVMLPSMVGTSTVNNSCSPLYLVFENWSQTFGNAADLAYAFPDGIADLKLYITL